MEYPMVMMRTAVVIASYFITKLKKQSKARYRRAVGNKGSWKQDAKGKPVHYKNIGNASSVVNIGSKMSLS